jgi:hypothetical protein
MNRGRVVVRVVAVLFLLRTAAEARGEEPALLRVQKVADTVYFHCRFDPPAKMKVPAIKPGPYGGWERRQLALTPQLVPQDGKTWSVYQLIELPHFRPAVQLQEQRPHEPVKGLEFAGKMRGTGKARLLLLYPTSVQDKPPTGIKNKDSAEALRPVLWAEVPVDLDLDRATLIPAEKDADKTQNLQSIWAEAQAGRLAILEALSGEFGFYGFACAATGRKYGVPDPVLEGERQKDHEHIHRRMLDLTTGTMAITQSLALKRLRGPGVRAPVERTVDISRVTGITIAEHPWKKMMAGKQPAAEPLAHLVPRDNYYIHFKSFAKFNEFQDFLDQWGTPAGRAYEVQSREYGLKERYERQLCLKSTWVGRQFGPLLVRSVAITGNDPFIREGSDVTVLFHVNNRQAFLSGVEPFLKEARKEFGDRMKTSKEMYHGIAVESFVSPLRQVSVHRAAFADFVVYSNSPAGLRRVLDTYKGNLPSLWDSLDFQYMRTVFQADDKEEDGFAFLSDAFIRQLVGPASKIKEMRRLEALTSLSMLTHGALFTAWETGKLPADHKALLDSVRLHPDHLYVPEGKPIHWDATNQVAMSGAYNTLHFATPLVELAIDKIAAFEEQTYSEFRDEYVRLWRRFFDPVGVRFALTNKQVKVDVYILPMINNQEYGMLRQLTGNGILHFDLARLSSRSLLQFTMSLNAWGGKGVGDWGIIRLDDNRTLARLAEWWMLNDLVAKDEIQHLDEGARLVFQLPLTVGIGIKDRTEFPAEQRQFTGLVRHWLGPVTVKTSKYKNATITRVKFGSDSQLVRGVSEQTKGKLKKVILYHAVIGDGWYAGFDKTALKDLIDRTEERTKTALVSQTVPINASLHLSPRSADQSGAALRQYLEWETHKRALPNNSLWYPLYRAGLIHYKTPERAKREAALKFLGFIPVSPDNAPYRYDDGKDEVRNARHGSLRQPMLHPELAEHSPLPALLAQFPALRIDLRFREDGFHSVITMERQPKTAR